MSKGYFKIVQTNEYGKSELAVVPSRWEKDGMLFWPTRASGSAAIASLKNPKSAPDELNWTKHECIVKRANKQWKLIEEAEMELEEMLKNDTSSSECENSTKMPPPKYNKGCLMKHRRTKSTIINADEQRIDFNIDATLMMDQQLQSVIYESPHQSHQQYSKESQPLPVASIITDQPQQSQSPVLLYQQQILTTQQQSHQQFPKESQPSIMKDQSQQSQSNQQFIYLSQDSSNTTILEPNNTLWTPPSGNGIDVCNIMSAVEALSENVLRMKQSFDHLNKKIDLWIEKSNDQQSKTPVISTSIEKIKDPIKTFDELCQLETKLKTNQQEFLHTIEKFKDVCGEKSMKGDNAAYTLVDLFFSRKLLTEFSWSGGSKGDAQKNHLNSSSKCLDLFYTLVKRPDPTYTEVEARNFFKKKVLPNSVRRSTASLIRVSHSKSRSKITKYLKNNENFDNENNCHLEDGTDNLLNEEDEELNDEESESELTGLKRKKIV